MDETGVIINAFATPSDEYLRATSLTFCCCFRGEGLRRKSSTLFKLIMIVKEVTKVSARNRFKSIITLVA